MLRKAYAKAKISNLISLSVIIWKLAIQRKPISTSRDSNNLDSEILETEFYDTVLNLYIFFVRNPFNTNMAAL